MSTEPIADDTETLADLVLILLRNWRDELILLWQTMREGEAPRETLRLTVTGADVLVQSVRDGRTVDLGRFARSAADAELLHDRLAESGLLQRGRADIELCFDEDDILRAQLRLPKAARSAIRGALGFELGRLSPVPTAELNYDYILGETRGSKIEVAPRALRRKLVDDAVAFAQTSGLKVAAIRLGADREEAHWRRFPVDRKALLRRGWGRWGAVALGVAAAVLGASLLLAVSARSVAADADLDAHIAAAQTQAAVVERAERDYAGERAQLTRLAARKSATSLVAALAALTETLPDGTWLNEIQYAQGKLHITGSSNAASELVLRLDRSGRFSQTQFNAPLVRNDADHTEHFDLTAVVGAGP